MEKIDLAGLVKFFFKYIIVVAAFVAGGVWLANRYTEDYVTKSYSSAVQIIVPLESTEENRSNLSGEINTNIMLIRTYADVVRSTVVLEKIAEAIEFEANDSYTVSQLRNAVTIEHNSDSQAFSLKVIAADPDDAALIANAAFDVFKANVEGLLGVTSIQAISKAVPNYTPDSPNLLKNLLLGALAGFMISVGMLVVLDYVKRSRESKELVISKVGITELGKISTISMRQSHYTHKKLLMLSEETKSLFRKDEEPAC